MKSLPRIILLCGAVLLATGCGVKTAYNNADWLLMRWVNDRVTLTPDQERALRSAIDDHLAWHCTSELPAYEAFLRSTEADVGNARMDKEIVERRGEQIAEFGRRIFDRVRPSLIDLLASLEEEQVSELMASFEKRNQELLEEAGLSEEERRRDRVEAMSKGMRRFAGRPTERQRGRLEAWARTLQPTAELALEERLAWQSAFGRTLARRQDRPAFDRAMSRLLEPGWHRSSSLEERRLENRERTIEVIVAMHDGAPPRQNRQLRESLSGLAEDLRELTCR